MSDRGTTSPDKQTLRIALQALAAKLGKTPSVVDIHKHSDYHPETYVEVFDSWDAALDAANLNPENVTRKITDTELLTELQRLTGELGRPPKKGELADQSKYSATTYQNRFGSWNNALQEAMLDTQRVTDRELIRELQRLAEDLDRSPRPGDMADQGHHGTVTYYRRFDTWDEALVKANLGTIDMEKDTEETINDALDVVATDGQYRTNTIASPQDLARTYNSQSYDDAWNAVIEYRRIVEYAADHPNKGSSAIASALDLPRSRIRPWLENDAQPDPVRGIQTAETNEWIPVSNTHNNFPALNVLVAWIFSGGSINTAYVPSFAVDREGTRARLTSTLDELKISYDVIRESEAEYGTEVRPTEDAAILGRVLATLGAPQGRKNAERELSLPSYLGYVSPNIREAFVDVYLRNQAQTYKDKAVLTVQENRSQVYLEELATLFRHVSGGTVSVADQNVHLLADAARNLYGKFGPQWD